MTQHETTNRTHRLTQAFFFTLIAGTMTFASSASSAPRAQGLDPSPPAGGFQIIENLDQTLSYSDGSKTKIDVRLPLANPSKNGWPVVFLIHGLGHDRKKDTRRARQLATAGYLVAGYDVRGQGDFNTLTTNTSMGTTIVGQEERLDLVEAVHFIEANYGSGPTPRADMDRLGICGESQGGIHSWAAAAWSGRALPANSRGIATFPVFKAACPSMFPPFTGDVVLPEGKAVHTSALGALFLIQVVRFESTFEQTMKGLLFTEQYDRARALIDSDPFRNDLQLLKSTQVPTLAQGGWNDSWADPNRIIDALASLPATTPTRLSLDPAIAHDVPDNDQRDELHNRLWTRWFARFLKGVQNGVDSEAKVQSTLRQETLTKELDPTNLPWSRDHDAWPPARTVTKRYYLDPANGLVTTAPTSSQPTSTIDHKVATSFDMAKFIGTVFTLPRYTSNFIPLSSVAYDMAPVTQETELAGSPTVRIFVDSTGKKFQVHCALFRVTRDNTEHMLGGGYALVDGSSAGKMTIDVRMIPMNLRILPGEKIRLRIENVVYRRLPEQDNYWVAPCFVSNSFAIEHSPSSPSAIDLPVRHAVQPSLQCSRVRLDFAHPRAVRYYLETPRSMAGGTYIVLFSMAGTATQTPLPGSDPFRLTMDTLTTSLLSYSGPLSANTGGSIPASGIVYPRLNIDLMHPLPAGLLGTRLSACAVVDGGVGLMASNPYDLLVR